ncbi:MAG TPA: sugar phosphate isomerase/epimerase family protein [Gemmataceae bacterium]|jgi:sugar phosphate isomerase/epimerase|nr:sugar phosphate isomerase/epimerase family protein [Gemmataceae bacterium]
MLFGYNTNGFAYHHLKDALAIIAELAYESVGLTLDYGPLNPYAPSRRLGIALTQGLLAENRLRSVIETGARFLLDPRHKHQPTLLSAKELDREKRLDFLCKAVDIAKELGADLVSFWSGTPLNQPGEAVLWDRLVAGCRHLCDYAEKQKVRLAFEPEPGMFIDTMARFAELKERVNHPLFGLTIDIGHLHCQGEIPISDHLRRWKDCLWNIHIEDMRRGVHEHLMFGEGEIDFVPVLRTLHEIGYQGGVHVELSRHSHDAVETARKAMAFLKHISHGLNAE